MSGQTTIERKYVLTKIKPGDYLLPSNDRETIWRIHRYQDGPSSGLDLPRDRDFWGVRRWTGDPKFLDISDEAWDRWELRTDFYDTRAEAIAGALSESV